jgi:hypothetical protein
MPGTCPTVFYGCLLCIRKGYRGGFCNLNIASVCLFGLLLRLLMRRLLSLQILQGAVGRTTSLLRRSALVLQT